MARRRQPPGRKRRTREHIIAELSVNYVERVVLLCGYAVERTTKDYGIDLTIETFDHRNELEVGKFELQVKATDRILLTADGGTVLQRVAIADLKSWLFSISLVILVVYDARAEVAYWVDVQEYARTTDFDIENFKTVALQIPVTNRWTPDVVRQLRALKNQLVVRMRRNKDEN